MGTFARQPIEMRVTRRELGVGIRDRDQRTTDGRVCVDRVCQTQHAQALGRARILLGSSQGNHRWSNEC